MTLSGGSVIQGYFPQGVPRIIASQPPAPGPAQPPAILRRTAHAPVPVAPVAQRAGRSQATPLPARLAPFAGAGGQRLPPAVQAKMEEVFKTSFAEVRVHVGPQAAAIGALAFAHGPNLYFAPGSYDPQSARGQQLLAHELTHVVQQRAGRVRNPFASGIAVVHDQALEHEAEQMGQRALRYTPPVQAKPAAPVAHPGASLHRQPSGVAQGRIAHPTMPPPRHILPKRAPAPPPPSPPRAGAAVVQAAKKSGEKDYSGANLRVVCSYSYDTGKRVCDAFLRAGYTMSNWEAAAKKAIKKTRWKREKIAHGLGKEGASGKRGGTDEEVQECANYLIEWAGNHPPETCKPQKFNYTRRDPEDDDKGGGGGSKGNFTSTSSFTYVAPWHGGPSAWYSRKTVY